LDLIASPKHPRIAKYLKLCMRIQDLPQQVHHSFFQIRTAHPEINVTVSQNNKNPCVEDRK
jgi:hypothetical protein